MDFKNFFNNFSFIGITLFAFFGLLVASNLVHELSHQQDLGEFVEEDFVCVLSANQLSSSAFYSYKIPPENQDEVGEVLRYTELKAQSFGFVLYLIFGAMFISLVKQKRFIKDVDERRTNKDVIISKG